MLRVTLSRPERRNALDRATLGAIDAAFRRPGDARAVVLTGAGPSFCAGADVAELQAGGDAAELVHASLALHRALTSVRRCPVPVVAGVQGHALGAGCALAACADVVVATPDARFGLPEVRVGVAPAVVAIFLAERMGHGALRRVALTGSTLNASEAVACGLADVLVDTVDEGVDGVVTDILRAAPGAVRATKRLLDAGWGPVQQARVMAELRQGAEAAEGLAAAGGRRQPDWTWPAETGDEGTEK